MSKWNGEKRCLGIAAGARPEGEETAKGEMWGGGGILTEAGLVNSEQANMAELSGGLACGGSEVLGKTRAKLVPRGEGLRAKKLGFQQCVRKKKKGEKGGREFFG